MPIIRNIENTISRTPNQGLKSARVTDIILDIKRIAAFQLKLFQLVKIVKSLVLTKYYRIEEPDLFYETLSKLDAVLWSKCYKMRGATSGLY